MQSEEVLVIHARLLRELDIVTQSPDTQSRKGFDQLVFRSYATAVREGLLGTLSFKRYEGTRFVHGLRGWAALGVLIIHSGGGGFRQLGDWGNRLVDLGAAGVYVFFVISGFAVSNAWHTNQNAGFSFWAFLRNRLARVVPLYYLWLFIAISFGATATYWQRYFDVEIDLYNLAVHLSFLSAFDGAVAASILGVEWTLPIEVFYYLIIPALLTLFLYRPWFGPILLVVGLSFWLGLRAAVFLSLLDSIERQMWLFSPVPYLFSFVAGVLVFQYRNSPRVSKFRNPWPLAIVIFWISFWSLVPGFSTWQLFEVVPITDRYLWVTALTALVILFLDDGFWPVRLLLTNRISVFLGSMSYGIYLSHNVLLQIPAIAMLSPLPKTVATIFLATGISFLTWIFLEYPIIRAIKRR